MSSFHFFPWRAPRILTPYSRPQGRNDLDTILIVVGSDMLRMLWVDMEEVSAYIRYK